ncbi:hypothetical protein ACIJYD_00715 [Candidatus Pelagibacter bacterium nBUS_33]|uniref:hypothetical protein n=1 Tax=Candidatus Pelagibacter bacterium nBUS_33 TaxID=3374193 RepID=UPI003EB8FA1D
MIKKIFNYLKYLKFNRKILKPSAKNKKNSIIIEFFDMRSFGISGSYFSHTLSRLHNSKIYTYRPSFLSTKNRLVHLLELLNPFSTLNFYNSFSNGFVIPNKNYDDQKFYKLNLKKIKSNQSLIKLKYKNIQIGDLIYDEFLARYKVHTINISSKKFKIFFAECMCLIKFWENFIKKNHVKSIVTSHSVYIMGLIARIGISYNIPVYVVGPHSHYKLTKEKYIKWSDQLEYPKQFKKFKRKIQKRMLIDSKNNIEQRLKGQKDLRYRFARDIKPVFSGNIINKKKKAKKDKLNILVAAHCFMDAPHTYGDMIFYDFFEWLNFLGKLSNHKKIKNMYNWHIKIHPALYDRNIKFFQLILNKYKNFNLVNKYETHNNLINNIGIDVVLTVYGSVAHEYPLFNIPVINAGKNPHEGYNFSQTVYDKSEYKKVINNLKSFKVKKNIKNKIYEFYGMHNLIEYNFFKNTGVKLEDWHKFKIIDIYFKNIKKLHVKKIKIYEDFILSKDRRLVDLNYDKN